MEGEGRGGEVSSRGVRGEGRERRRNERGRRGRGEEREEEDGWVEWVEESVWMIRTEECKLLILWSREVPSWERVDGR